MTNTTKIIRMTTRLAAASFVAATLSFSITGASHAQVRTHVIGNTMQMPNPQLLKQMQAAQNRRAALRTKGFNKATQKLLNGKSSAGQKLRAKGNAAKQIRQNAKMRQMFKQKLTNSPKGILKRPGAAKVKKNVKFNLKHLGKGKKYRAKHIKTKNVRFPGKKAKNMRNLHNAGKAAQKARVARNVHKASKAAKLAIAGTGVGAVATIGAGMAGLDPVEMATLKATNPAEYNRRMRDLKKNPVKYVGKNIANNTKKTVQNVGNAGKKFGCGVGNAFKKKSNKKKC